MLRSALPNVYPFERREIGEVKKQFCADKNAGLLEHILKAREGDKRARAYSCTIYKAEYEI